EIFLRPIGMLSCHCWLLGLKETQQENNTSMYIIHSRTRLILKWWKSLSSNVSCDEAHLLVHVSRSERLKQSGAHVLVSGEVSAKRLKLRFLPNDLGQGYRLRFDLSQPLISDRGELIAAMAVAAASGAAAAKAIDFNILPWGKRNGIGWT
ncbi:MAG TPA: hypothetical protein VHP35_06820, partial [Terriglobia bacterium]|nr:hypothetical protein [Terriglobia bacterium]